MAMEISGRIPVELHHLYPDKSFAIKINDFGKNGVGFSNRFFFEERKVRLDQKGCFEIDLDAHSDYIYIAFEGLRDNHKQVLWEGYLLDTRGDLHIDFSTAPFSFSGKNAPLMYLQMDVLQQAKQFRDMAADEWGGYLAELKAWLPNRLKSIDEVVADYQGTLNADVRNIVGMNARNKLLSSISNAIPRWLDRKGNESLAPVASLCEQMKSYREELVARDVEIEYSYNIGEVWLDIHRSELVLAGLGIHSDSLMMQLLEATREVANPTLRDRILMTFFFSPKYSHSYNKTLHTAIELSSSKSVSEALVTHLERHAEKSEVENFCFLDQDGQNVTLDAFKGRLVVAHFWFNGCTGCRIMTEYLAPIAGKYEGSVIFLAINVDYRAKRWADGLARGGYSTHHDINLWTGELGFKHPMLEDYNFIGFPQLILIDQNGNLITAQAPSMVDKKHFQGELEKLINHYL